MKKNLLCSLAATAMVGFTSTPAMACTGMSMKAKDGSEVVARTIDWGGNEVENFYTVVPRGYVQRSFLPENNQYGAPFGGRYGYVGLAMGEEAFVVEGLNEAGLSSGLFYFPDYGQYPVYDTRRKAHTVADLQLVSYLLSSYATVDEAIEGIRKIDVISIYPGASTAHWRIADKSGRQVVLEYVGGKPHFYENKVGVITNSPGFEWQLTNLNNYINVTGGTYSPKMLGNQPLNSIGSGSGFLGLPGDFTPPSRFVRAAFLLNTTRQQADGLHAVLQLFHLLNTFDVPVACDTPIGQEPGNFPSATQWTVATDITAGIIYYRTMYNCNIRSIQLKEIDFNRVAFIAKPLDATKEQPIERIVIE
ncbi:MAG: linear amide C-N hydrolase [Mediterranea massiliensis]|nr:linear amide C-N hydrolase [Mediterranea massiliensis]